MTHELSVITYEWWVSGAYLRKFFVRKYNANMPIYEQTNTISDFFDAFKHFQVDQYSRICMISNGSKFLINMVIGNITCKHHLETPLFTWKRHYELGNVTFNLETSPITTWILLWFISVSFLSVNDFDADVAYVKHFFK